MIVFQNINTLTVNWRRQKFQIILEKESALHPEFFISYFPGMKAMTEHI